MFSAYMQQIACGNVDIAWVPAGALTDKECSTLKYIIIIIPSLLKQDLNLVAYIGGKSILRAMRPSHAHVAIVHKHEWV